MGRLVGILHFFTEATWSEEKDDAAAVQRAKKLDVSPGCEVSAGPSHWSFSQKDD